MLDQRVVYGARCTWWDSVYRAVPSGLGLPSCPHCGSPLFEVPSETAWWSQVDDYAARHPGYRQLVEWGRGRCHPTVAGLRDAYVAATRAQI